MDGYPGGRKGLGSCDLFISYSLGNEKWSTPENMGAPVNSEYWDSQPSLAADGQTIYFISNRPGGKGGADMWKCTKNAQGKWANLTNMGDSVNTAFNEESPFIHPDGKSLYFSSDGWPGMGNKDIFLTRLKSNNQFGTPINLGYPINTDENERDLIVTANGKTAFFSSERNEGSGGQDLYYFDLYPAVRPLPVTYVKGKVFDKGTKKGLRADFELLDLETGNKVMEASSNIGSGEYLICIPSGKNYAMNVSKQGYLFNSENFSLKDKIDLATFELNMPLIPIKAGEKVVLKNIFFETGSFKLKDESKAELQKLIVFLTANISLKIEIGGHTDNVGDKKSNEVLSQNRAKAVYDYLVTNMVAPTRLSYKGFGDKQPISTNETDEGKAANRRTEFTVMP
jgi:outer membrane protein OmpA-like peptidoglycan-associated protein